MAIIDLKFYSFLERIYGKTLGRGKHVCRTIDFQASYGFHTLADVSAWRGQVSKRLLSKIIFLPRPISLYGFCPNHFHRESPRYRGMSSVSKQETLLHGYSWQSLLINSCRRKQKSRLANLRRTVSESHRNCTRFLRTRLLHRRSGRNHIRFGVNDYRPLSFSFPVGNFSQKKSCDQTPYITAPQHPRFHPHFRRQTARHQRPRPFTFGSLGLLCHGPRLSGLQKIVYLQQDTNLLRNPHKIKYKKQTTLLHTGRQKYRITLRPDSYADRILYQKRIFGATSSCEISRYKNKQDTGFSYKQFFFTSINYNSTVLQPLAGGVVFQVDQTAPQNKELFQDIGKRGQVPDLDCRISLCSCSNHEKATQPPRKSLHNFTDFKRINFQKDPDLSTGY